MKTRTSSIFTKRFETLSSVNPLSFFPPGLVPLIQSYDSSYENLIANYNEEKDMAQLVIVRNLSDKRHLYKSLLLTTIEGYVRTVEYLLRHHLPFPQLRVGVFEPEDSSPIPPKFINKSIDSTYSYHGSLLHFVCRLQHYGMCLMILKEYPNSFDFAELSTHCANGPPPSGGPTSYWTPLEETARTGNADIVSLLLKYKAPPILSNLSSDEVSPQIAAIVKRVANKEEIFKVEAKRCCVIL